VEAFKFAEVIQKGPQGNDDTHPLRLWPRRAVGAFAVQLSSPRWGRLLIQRTVSLPSMRPSHPMRFLYEPFPRLKRILSQQTLSGLLCEIGSLANGVHPVQVAQKTLIALLTMMLKLADLWSHPSASKLGGIVFRLPDC
jgi:hypothetical protein